MIYEPIITTDQIIDNLEVIRERIEKRRRVVELEFASLEVEERNFEIMGNIIRKVFLEGDTYENLNSILVRANNRILTIESADEREILQEATKKLSQLLDDHQEGRLSMLEVYLQLAPIFEILVSDLIKEAEKGYEN